MMRSSLGSPLMEIATHVTHVGVQRAGWDAAVKAFPPKLAFFSHKGANALTSQYRQSTQCCPYHGSNHLRWSSQCAQSGCWGAAGRIGFATRRTPYTASSRSTAYSRDINTADTNFRPTGLQGRATSHQVMGPEERAMKHSQDSVSR